MLANTGLVAGFRSIILLTSHRQPDPAAFQRPVSSNCWTRRRNRNCKVLAMKGSSTYSCGVEATLRLAARACNAAFPNLLLHDGWNRNSAAHVSERGATVGKSKRDESQRE